MIVYRIYERNTGKSYIGQTGRTLSQRIYAHLHNKKSLIGKAMREQGQENFDISVLDVCEDRESAYKAEKFWIKFYNSIENGYNIHEGGKIDAHWMNEIRQLSGNHKNEHTRKYKKKRTYNPNRIISKKEIADWEEKKRKRQDEGIQAVREMMKEKETPTVTAKDIYQHEAEVLKNIVTMQRTFA